jgi:hypothetical protein
MRSWQSGLTRITCVRQWSQLIVMWERVRLRPRMGGSITSCRRLMSPGGLLRLLQTVGFVQLRLRPLGSHRHRARSRCDIFFEPVLSPSPVLVAAAVRLQQVRLCRRHSRSAGRHEPPYTFTDQQLGSRAAGRVPVAAGQLTVTWSRLTSRFKRRSATRPAHERHCYTDGRDQDS